jgi:GrpB-like predicted nucleotidyltransferase (UPF0157 family)
MNPPELPIRPYERKPAVVAEHDPRALGAAARLADLIAAARPGTTVEHIGSSAVPGLPGKGVIDLLIPADPDEIPSIVSAMLGIGFERQDSPDPFPPERPLLLGAIDHEGTRFRIHAHIVPAGSAEPAELRGFRDALIADPELRAAYAARKRAIVDAGTSDSREYSVIKGDWVLDTLTRLGLRPPPEP